MTPNGFVVALALVSLPGTDTHTKEFVHPPTATEWSHFYKYAKFVRTLEYTGKYRERLAESVPLLDTLLRRDLDGLEVFEGFYLPREDVEGCGPEGGCAGFFVVDAY